MQLTPLVSEAQIYDITENYLQNARFDASFDYTIESTTNVRNSVKDISGWNKNTTASTSAVAATFQYGTQATISGKQVPSVGYDETADGGCLALWATTYKQLIYLQNVQLPAGNYQVVYAYYNFNDEATSGTSLFGWVPSEGDAQLSTLQAFEQGKWLTDTISFNLKETTRGAIQIGIKSDSGKSYAMIAIDFIKLLRDTPYGDIDITGEKPTVITDMRFARGATMAFGRMTASLTDGGTITESGFCYSENPEPTIDDFTTTTTLNNNGDIYWLKNLKPATKYFMRAYAKTSGRNIGYGDVIKFYTIPKGQISFSMRTSGDAHSERIKAAAQTAIDWWNNLTEMKGFSTSIGYNSGTPTAECSYGGWMSVGSNSSYQRAGTIMHEMLHGCGVIPWADTEWAKFDLRSGTSNAAGFTTGSGLWLGDRVTEVLRFWDNSTTSQLNGDYQHMWPYGINGASEDNGSDVLYIGTSLICQALGEDGLQHTNSLFAEPYYAFNQEDTVKYYIKNENLERGLYSAYLIPTKDGKLVWRDINMEEASANDSTAWYITFTPNNQYYQFRNAATGQYLTYASGLKMATRSSLSSNEDFHIMKGRVNVVSGNKKLRGYWIIHPTNSWTPPCMQANASGTISTATFNISNKATSQRWLIMTADEMAEFDKTALKAIRQKTADALKYIKALAQVPHSEIENGADQTFSEELTRIEQLLNTATNTSELLPLVDEANQAAYIFLSSVTPTDIEQPFDLTYLIQNPGMDSTDGWQGTPTLSYSCAEYYQSAFNFYQIVNQLPSGTYQCCMQGFQRPGTSADSYNSFNDGTNNVNAYLYAGNESQLIKHIAADAQSAMLGGKESSVGTNLYMPNDMHSASIYFAKNLYENKVVTSIDDTEHSLRIGLRCSSMPSYYWCIFDNFRLYFYGTISSEQLSGIIESKMENSTIQQTYFDLQGRRVTSPSRGLYIINGKKLVLK